MYVLVWMYNEFLFFYKKEPYKQFIWRYMGQISPQIREKSSLGHFCHHFLYIKGNGKEGKVHFDLVYTDMAKTTIRHVVFNLSENRFRLDASPASMPLTFLRGEQLTRLMSVSFQFVVPVNHTFIPGCIETQTA